MPCYMAALRRSKVIPSPPRPSTPSSACVMATVAISATTSMTRFVGSGQSSNRMEVWGTRGGPKSIYVNGEKQKSCLVEMPFKVTWWCWVHHVTDRYPWMLGRFLFLINLRSSSTAKNVCPKKFHFNSIQHLFHHAISNASVAPSFGSLLQLRWVAGGLCDKKPIKTPWPACASQILAIFEGKGIMLATTQLPKIQLTEPVDSPTTPWLPRPPSPKSPFCPWPMKTSPLCGSISPTFSADLGMDTDGCWVSGVVLRELSVATKKLTTCSLRLQLSHFK